MTRIPGALRHLYPENWTAISRRAKARDEWLCAGCGDTFKLLRFQLETHHIDGNPQNNHPENLIAVCEHHHHKVGGMIPRPGTRLEVIQRLRSPGRELYVRF